MLGALRQLSRLNTIKNLGCYNKLNLSNKQFVRFDHHTSNMAKALVIVADGTEEMEAVG